ncbi:MAG: PorV/PorQ family protein, partial [Candidatus Zixiibacteriota bacterium]
LLYRFHRRWTLGVAITNLGPDVSYIDVAQADPLPRNLAVGLATNLIQSDYNNLLLTGEINKSLVGFDDSFSEEIKEIIYNGGIEYRYGSFIAFRGGYIYDQEGEVKTPTLGFGLSYRKFKFDFAYIPSNDDVPLANTMRLSLSAIF